MTTKRRIDYLIVIHDRRGRGLRRFFGPFRKPGRAAELVEMINQCSRERGPRLEGSREPAITAGLGWLHSGRRATLREVLDDPPHPDTGVRPSQEAGA